MRIRGLVLVVAAALACATPAATAVGSTGYVWAEPGAALVGNPFSSLPILLASIPGPRTLAELPILTSYAWAQPGTATVPVELAQPWLV